MKSITMKRPYLISIFCAAILLVGSTAIATTSGITEKKCTFKITSKIFRDGKIISSPQIISYANQKAVIVLSNHGGSQGVRMELVASNATFPGIKNGIELNYDVRIRNEQAPIHSKQHIVVAPNVERTISLASDSGHQYEMRVMARRE